MSSDDKSSDDKDREEIGFDLKKIRLFSGRKKKKRAEKKEAEEQEDMSIDFGTIKKYAMKYSFVLFILIPIIFSIFLRVQPAYMPITSDWAKSSIENTIKSNLQAQVNSNYPNLPDSQKAQAVNDQLNQILEAGSINIGGQQVSIDEAIQQNAEYFKSRFQDESGHTYLLAIDPYYYYRQTRNLINNGYAWDYVDANGKYHDTKVLAGKPLGEGNDKKVPNLHIWVEYYTYKIIHLFNPNMDLMGAIFYVPVIIGTLAVIPAFFIARKVSGNIGGFFAGLLIAIHPAFLSRTAGGFADTDAYNVFFPLVIMWLLIEAYEAKGMKKSITMASLAGLAIGLFSYVWSGWFFIIDLTLAVAVVLILYLIIMQRKNIKKGVKAPLKNNDLEIISIASGILILSSVIFVSMLSSFSKILNFLQSTFMFTQIKAVGTLKIWPNVYTTVAELNPATLAQTISQISLGSKVWLFFGLLGLILPLSRLRKENKNSLWFTVISAVWFIFIILIQKSLTSHIAYAVLISMPLAAWLIMSVVRDEKIDVKYSIFLTLWFGATIYASSKGVRFILLLVPAFAVAAGVTTGILSRALSRWLSTGFNINKVVTQVVVFGLFFILLFYPTNFVKASMDTAKNEIPSMNDAWYGLLTQIKEESQPDAIINSWWDFGHWFAAIAQRRVTLDGGRQNNPAAHWLGKLMLTENETESVGILRYLDCGSNTGFDTLLGYMGNDSLETINTIYQMIVVDRDKAKDILMDKGLSSEQADDVLQYTHCSPPEDYFITSEDMVGKSGVWAHFGAWNFTRAVMYNKVYNKDEATGVKILMDEFGYNSSAASSLYNEIRVSDPDQWISPWPSYASGLSSCSVSGNQVMCSNGVIFDTEKDEATVQIQQGGGVKNIKDIAYIDKNGIFREKVTNNNYVTAQNGRPLGAAIIPDGSGGYSSVLMDSELTASMFTRLFYFDGYGLRYFKEYDDRRDITGARIITWKIDWQGSEVNTSEIQESTENATDSDSADAINDTTTDSFSLAMIQHILISTANRSDQDARELADQVYSMINSTNFQEIADKYSECSDSTIKCSLGWFGRGVLEKSMEDAAFSLQKNEVSPPVKTSQGYEIIKLVDSK